ncbi:GntR family transcriptional regulator [Actinotignum sp. GS-2025e]|uniref:GntR family transcriptional regulator n=1 Tax=Actinotignum sp. GS-2025e TaxID=3427278 RepID=UPI003F45DE6C
MHTESPGLDRNAPTPIFRQLATWMREQVSTGAWRRGDQLPMEITLAEQLNVARGTLRKAVDQLIDEGLLVRVRGRGTFIAHDIVRSPLTSSLTTLAEELEQRGIDYTTRVLAQEVIPAPPPIAAALGVDGNIFHLRRMRGDAEGSITLLDNWVILPPALRGTRRPRQAGLRGEFPFRHPGKRPRHRPLPRQPHHLRRRG